MEAKKHILSGEAHSRANIDLPGGQQELLDKLQKTGKPIVLIVMAGRPITLGKIIDKVDAVIMAWHPGTMGGPALKDLITGKVSPSGRLPITWPKEVGQIPIHYNHKKHRKTCNPRRICTYGFYSYWRMAKFFRKYFSLSRCRIFTTIPFWLWVIL